ncbi:MAG: ATP-binding protein [Desulfovibrionaceae bacterium]|nr:ATP-binding protein [Desulfovibrionaceae bacterium]
MSQAASSPVPAPRCVLMIGLPGSGKSTCVAQELVPRGYQVICQDDIRAAYGHRFFGPLEPFIHSVAYMQLRQFLLRGLNVVIDESLCRAGHLRLWKERAEALGAVVSAVYRDAPVAVCKERRIKDDPGFPLGVIDAKAEDLRRDWPDIRALFPYLPPVPWPEPDAGNGGENA